MFDVTVKEHQPDFVVVARSREGEERAKLGGSVPFRPGTGTKILRRGDIRHQHQRELALFDVTLYEGRTSARGDIPIDGANVIANGIRADLIELDARAFEYRDVLARQDIGDLTTGAQLDFLDATNDLRCKHEWGQALRNEHSVQDPLNDVVWREAFCFGFVRERDSVPEYVRGERLRIVRRDVGPTL